MCPEEGSFIGWKYVTFPASILENSEQHTDWCAVLVKLKIPEDAKRSSGFSRKCRASKVEVLGFYATDGTRLDDIYEVNHIDVFSIVYKIGECTYPDSFNEDRYVECSHGIHFFVSKDDAIQYGKDNVRGLIFVEHADDDDFAYTKLKETVNGYNDSTNKDS